MKTKTRTIVFALWCVSALLGSCNLPPANNPRAIAEAFLNDLKNTELKKAAEYGTDTAKQLILLMDMLKENVPKEELDKTRGQKVVIDGVDEQSTTATVRYHLDNDPVQTLDLIKINGIWKVDFKKQV
jgi:hypothetical protein